MFVDWLSRNQNETASVFTFDCVSDILLIWFLQNTTNVLVDLMDWFLCWICYTSFIWVNYWVPCFFYWYFENSIFWQCYVHIISRSVIFDWSFVSFPLSAYNFDLSSIFLESGYFVGCVLLIFGLLHFVFAFQVQPQLESNWIFLGWAGHLRMDDSFACSHPLQITWANCSFMPFEILVMHFPWLHVSDRFESSVGMVRESCWQSHFEMVQH